MEPPDAAAAAAVSAANTVVSSAITTTTTSATTLITVTTTTTTTSTAPFAAAPGMRAVTPIGPPNKRNVGSPVPAVTATSTLQSHQQPTQIQQAQKQPQATQLQQHSAAVTSTQPRVGTAPDSQQHLVINCAELTSNSGGTGSDNANQAGLKNATAGGFGAQLASKISKEYTLFFIRRIL
ncbi:uncharacterized protein LOC129242201 [Anastrepha obliqua]|uniref:uncharacterized protein LOC129242201 n=1 Tax=Anastrepha obliqua TaxID=95512 RepID=UPI0024091C83|nr:uncharacterized protein LOC129242201 [Anastrepha obliqua]